MVGHVERETGKGVVIGRWKRVDSERYEDQS